MAMELSSPAFPAGGRIPVEHTCDGADRSPPLRWAGVPQGTVELALLVEDPDAPAGTFVHWVLAGLDPKLGELPPGTVPPGAREGRNGYGRRGWAGPCPPRGKPHRYVFTLFALSRPSGLEEGASAADLRKAIEGAVLAQASLTGLYGR